MKKFTKNSIMVLVILLTISLPLTGCNQTGTVQDDLDEDLGGGLAGELAGGDIGTENVWPDSMPEKVPEFTEGIIVSTSGTRVGGQDNINIALESVSQGAFDAYIMEIEGSVFEYLTGSDSGGITAKTYVEGENVISVQYAGKTGEMTISFSGN
ncbi:MAG: hypothetical protein KAH14_08650 [Clostridiales bacterium]|nr:hypothetical protein [Clostridiales bacterium]